MSDEKTVRAALARIREICGANPGSQERPSHGAPAFFVGKKQYAHFWNDHHGDGRLAVTCRADPAMRDLWISADGERFFLPPYVAHLGWVGIRLEGKAPWKKIAGILKEAAGLTGGGGAKKASARPRRRS